ncbi:SH3 and multiple ankyrin repeat domains protein 2 [Caerostris extrusa]|uniref:SH3 and multiple ankyrin repeat domains protein 2 n=1 Tax=Caerostris extrusa TaxID=172846 RepID=A0AAV4SFL6_CAEEX|nr:SH3 and multiple ankyrin repeat domains protein 2 [Caerostris extrusa]
MKHHRRSKHKSKEDVDYRIPKNYSSTPELTYLAAPDYEAVTYLKRWRSLSDLHPGTPGGMRGWDRKGSGGREHRHNRRDKPVHRQHSIPEATRATHGDMLQDRSATQSYRDHLSSNKTVRTTQRRCRSPVPASPRYPKRLPRSRNCLGGRSSTASLDADNSSGDSSSTYTPFKGSHRSRDHPGDQAGIPPDRRGTLRKVKQQGKFPAAVTGICESKHYPTLSQEADFDTSEEEDATSGLEPRNDLVTFKAPDSETPQRAGGRSK